MRLRRKKQEQTGPRRSTRSRITLLIGERRRTVVALSVGAIFAGFTEAATLTLIAEIAAALVTGAKTVHAHVGSVHITVAVGTLIIIAFVAALLRIAFQIPLAVLPARIGADVQANLRRALFGAFAGASWSVQSQDREGQLQETMTSQVIAATGGALQATQLIITSFTFLVLITVALLLNAIAAVVVGVTSVVMFALLRPLRGRGVAYSRALSKAQMEYAGGIAQAIRVAEETHVFGVVGAQRAHIDALVQKSRGFYFRTALLSKLVGSLYQSLIMLLLLGGIAGLYLVGGGHAGALGGVVLLLVRAGGAGQMVQGSYQGVAQAIPYIERTQEAIRRYADSSPVDGERRLSHIDTLAFDDVSFSYRPDQPVLNDISFEIDRGEVIGIIGPSGAGKSTLVQLLLQLRVPEQGFYLINGLPAAEFSRADWHSQVSYVPQEPRLLHATVSENIRFFRDIDQGAIERAARLARIHDDIMSWSKGYETLVGPRADAVSGGQQQRLCLARALAARPEVLVLDEPTSALDPQSEALISASLEALRSELTLFIIAHRMSTLDMCDRVMVIVDGRLVAFDTKALLQTQNSYYKHASALATRHVEGQLS
jgi:ATP-binding cassette, subfamily B, bacterial